VGCKGWGGEERAGNGRRDRGREGRGGEVNPEGRNGDGGGQEIEGMRWDEGGGLGSGVSSRKERSLKGAR